MIILIIDKYLQIDTARHSGAFVTPAKPLWDYIFNKRILFEVRGPVHHSKIHT
jgi:hypothetical protein